MAKSSEIITLDAFCNIDTVSPAALQGRRNREGISLGSRPVVGLNGEFCMDQMDQMPAYSAAFPGSMQSVVDGISPSGNSDFLDNPPGVREVEGAVPLRRSEPVRHDHGADGRVRGSV